MACGFGACFGCVVPHARAATGESASTGRVLAAAELDEAWLDALTLAPALDVELAGLELAHPVLNGSGTFDAIAALRTFGTGCYERFPFSAFVSKTITAEPREGNPPPRLWETPAGHDQLDRAPQQGPRGLSRAGPARAGDAPGAADRERRRLHHDEFATLVETVAAEGPRSPRSS